MAPPRVDGMEASLDAQSWQRVVGEIQQSCARRASAEELFIVPGAVGVLAGAAPALWVHGEVDEEAIARILTCSPAVADVYLATDSGEIPAWLGAGGWRLQELLTQVVCERATWRWSERPTRVAELTASDLPAFRRTLASASGADDHTLASSFGDDFFERAKPAWLFGARDGDVIVGTAGMRLQQESAMLFALSVEPAHRGTGVAQELVRAALGKAFAAGASFVHAMAGPASVEVGRACGARAVGTWMHLVQDNRLVTAA